MDPSIASTRREEDLPEVHRKIIKFVRDAGAVGAARQDMVDAGVAHSTVFTNAIPELLASGHLVGRQIQNGGAGRPRRQLFAPEYAPDDGTPNLVVEMPLPGPVASFLTGGAQPEMLEADARDDTAEAEDDEDQDEDEDEDEESERKPAPPVKKAAQPRKKEPPVSKKDPREPKAHALDEIPREALLELESGGYREISLEIKRKLPGSGFAEVRRNIRMPISGLYDLREGVMELAGGGKFMFGVVEPETKELLVPRWYETYEGPPRAPDKSLTLVWDEDKNRLRAITYHESTGGAVPLGGAFSMSNALTRPNTASSYAVTSGEGQPTPRPQRSMSELFQIAAQQVPQPIVDANGRITQPPPPEVLPGWARKPGWTHEQMWEMVIQQRVEKLVAEEQQMAQAGLTGTWVSHEIREKGDLKAELAASQGRLQALEQQTRMQLEAMKRETESILERERERRAAAEKELERARHTSELAALRAQIESIKNTPPVEQPRPPSLVEQLAALAPFVPVFTALVESSRASQVKQTEMMLGVLTSTKKEGTDTAALLTALAPFAVPVLTKWMENTGPQATAEVHAIEHEQRMMQLKLMADVIKEMAPGEGSPWAPLLEGVANMIAQGAQRMLTPRMLPPPAQTQQLPANTGGGQQAASPMQQILERMAQQDPQAAQAVQMIYQQLPPEFGYHTHEWMTLLFNIHVRQQPDELAPKIANHLINCSNFESLPQQLVGLFEQETEEGIYNQIMSVFSVLPIYTQDQAYVEQLTREVTAILASDDEDEEEEEEPAVTSPAAPIEAQVRRAATTPRAKKSEATTLVRQDQPIRTPAPTPTPVAAGNGG